LHDSAELLLFSLHLGKGNVLRPVRSAEQNAGVLLREKAFGDDDEQIAGRNERRQKDAERGEL